MSEIATLPAIQPPETLGYPSSERTGEPKRPTPLLVGVGFAWLSVAVVMGAFGWWWWTVATNVPLFAPDQMTTIPPVARILVWVHPDPVSALAIVMVFVMGLIGLLMVAAAGVVGFNAWRGASWIRIGALVCLAVQLLSLLVNWWFTAAMAPLAVACALLWLPSTKRFIATMTASTKVTVVEPPTSGILYGPQPLIGSRG